MCAKGVCVCCAGSLQQQHLPAPPRSSTLLTPTPVGGECAALPPTRMPPPSPPTQPHLQQVQVCAGADEVQQAVDLLLTRIARHSTVGVVQHLPAGREGRGTPANEGAMSVGVCCTLDSAVWFPIEPWYTGVVDTTGTLLLLLLLVLYGTAASMCQQTGAAASLVLVACCAPSWG